MKYRFTCATSVGQRKGRELLAPSPINHPARETVIHPVDSHLPHLHPSVRVTAKPEDKPQPTEEERLKMEIARVMAERSKAPRPIPKSKLIGLGVGTAPDPSREYADVLAMLLGRK